ncbi:MAG TPA: hypothetical protein VIC82_10450 [Candidatus Nanopelagicales bacterium]
MTRRSRRRPLLDGLRGEEAARVLGRLLDEHPELVGEVEELARAELGAVASDSLVAEVIAAIDGIGLDQLNARSGRIPGRGYVHEVDAAYELVEGAIEPYHEDIRRRTRLGFVEAASEIVMAVLDALAEVVPAKEGSVLAYAGEDVPGELAGELIREAKSLGLHVSPDREPRW